ncbi:hypothetical protein PVAND_014160 [Polypedilum vanderplanki]|uniref:glutathione transferase n=1 Tax=Polypedilum vanderplanki TaxID=319348 RepID=A0A9J6CRW7_POLVA|nr:hypothetical protein PVAND_014160 [Polypedilum vanderplanki]
MSKPTLYYHPLSPPSRAPCLIAKEIGLDINLEVIDFLNSEHTSEKFTKINPAQTIPAMVDSDFIVCDSHAICIYLIEKYAKDDYLYPKNDLKLRTVINDRLFFDASFLFPRGLNVMLPVVMQGQAEVPEEKVQQIHRGYRIVENYLSTSKWIASNDHMTLADLAIFAWMESFTQVFTIENYPKLTTWLKEMRKLPYYEEANKKGADLHIQIFRSALEKNKKAKK